MLNVAQLDRLGPMWPMDMGDCTPMQATVLIEQFTVFRGYGWTAGDVYKQRTTFGYRIGGKVMTLDRIQELLGFVRHISVCDPELAKNPNSLLALQ